MSTSEKTIMVPLKGNEDNLRAYLAEIASTDSSIVSLYDRLDQRYDMLKLGRPITRSEVEGDKKLEAALSWLAPLYRRLVIDHITSIGNEGFQYNQLGEKENPEDTLEGINIRYDIAE